MSARQVRVETRSRHQSDLKRVMHSTARVRKWEKKWVQVGDSSMQIFKWMPIKADEQQQQPLGHNTIVHKTQQLAPMREVLTTANSNVPQDSDTGKSIEKTNLADSKMMLASNHHEINSNESQSDEHSKNTSPTILNNNHTTMHRQQDRVNKRKLDEFDLSSSDSFGSSSCGSSNGIGESNSNSATDELEKTSKRQKTYDSSENVAHFDMLIDATPTTTTAPPSHIIQTAIDQNQVNVVGDQSQKTNEMIVDAPAGANVTTNGQNSISNTLEESMDSNEDLSSVARSVTEQIVTRVSDCYMDI